MRSIVLNSIGERFTFTSHPSLSCLVTRYVGDKLYADLIDKEIVNEFNQNTCLDNVVNERNAFEVLTLCCLSTEC